MSDPRAHAWEVDGLSLAGLSWGPRDGVPVLALHGWMDHAESFAELAPRLRGCHVVAIDLSGQGLSGMRAAHATYNIWDDLPQIAGLLDDLGWPDCVLMGHSRGANIATLFAAAQPERVRALVAIESLLPEPSEPGSAARTLRAFVEGARRQTGRAPRVFASKSDYVERRRAQGNARATSEALAHRALAPHPEGYALRGDPRLFASSAVKFTRTDLEAILRAVRCPVLNVWASDGIASRREGVAEIADLAQRLLASCERVTFAGDHHLHLSPEPAGRIADAVLEFLDRHGAA